MCPCLKCRVLKAYVEWMDDQPDESIDIRDVVNQLSGAVSLIIHEHPAYAHYQAIDIAVIGRGEETLN
jgi:hypothetical protein